MARLRLARGGGQAPHLRQAPHGSIATATAPPGRLAVATRGALARGVHLRVRAVAQHVLARLHRRIGEVLAAVARHDGARGETDEQRDDDQEPGHRRDCTLVTQGPRRLSSDDSRSRCTDRGDRGDRGDPSRGRAQTAPPRSRRRRAQAPPRGRRRSKPSRDNRRRRSPRSASAGGSLPPPPRRSAPRSARAAAPSPPRRDPLPPLPDGSSPRSTRRRQRRARPRATRAPPNSIGPYDTR